MRIDQFIWDLEDDPEGNIQHIAEHDVTADEVEEVLLAARKLLASRSSGRPIIFGSTSTGRHLAVVFEVVSEIPLAVYVLTAYETEP